MRKLSILKKSSIALVGIFMMIFTFTAANVNISAAQIINFSGAGVLTVNNDGSFDAVGANIASGTMDADTSIVADGNLELILNNTVNVSLSSIDAKANLTINGSGILDINNTNGPGITMAGDLEINTKLSVTGSTYGILSPGVGNITLNHAVLKTSGKNQTGVSMQNGDITVNGGQLYDNSMFSAISNQTGDINVLGSAGLIETSTNGGLTIRATYGNILIDEGRIHVPDSKFDAISVGSDAGTVTIRNGGVAEGRGANCGVGGGTIIVDNATIIGKSKRIGVSAELDLIVQNGGVVTGNVSDATSQNFGVISWGGDIIVNDDSVVTGTAEIGVLAFDGSIKALGGEISGLGELIGVEAVESIVAEDGGTIIGESSKQEKIARGIGAKESIHADNGVIIGSSFHRGVYANGTMTANNNSLIKGNADVRVDESASVTATSITANSGSTIYETYAADVTHINDKEINPYFNSTNMNDFKNFDWIATTGSVKKGTNGIIATAPCNGGTMLTAERTHESGVNEVVELTATGMNKHIIELPVVITPKGVPVDPGKPIIDPKKPDVNAPSIQEGVIIGTRSGPNTGDQNSNASYLGMILISLAALAMGLKKNKN